MKLTKAINLHKQFMAMVSDKEKMCHNCSLHFKILELLEANEINIK